MSLGMMTPLHPQWHEFYKRLEGPDGCNFREKTPGDKNSITWDCTATAERAHAQKILRAMGATDQEVWMSIGFFSANGGMCDCEIIFNVEASAGPRPRKHRKRAKPNRAARRRGGAR